MGHGAPYYIWFDPLLYCYFTCKISKEARVAKVLKKKNRGAAEGRSNSRCDTEVSLIAQHALWGTEALSDPQKVSRQNSLHANDGKPRRSEHDLSLFASHPSIFVSLLASQSSRSSQSPLQRPWLQRRRLWCHLLRCHHRSQRLHLPLWGEIGAFRSSRIRYFLWSSKNFLVVLIRIL